MQIDAVQRCQAKKVVRVVDAADDQWESRILASPSRGFTSVLGAAWIEGDEITLGRAEALQLQVEAGSICHVLPLRPAATVDQEAAEILRS
jgi:hypothetical protein